MENKQTAIDYIVNVVNSCIAPDYIPNEIVMQAKQMEKEQIINAFGEKRQFIGFGDNDTFGLTEKTGQEYYNETYGKD